MLRNLDKKRKQKHCLYLSINQKLYYDGHISIYDCLYGALTIISP